LQAAKRSLVSPSIGTSQWISNIPLTVANLFNTR
jgi:hypothetical protein